MHIELKRYPMLPEEPAHRRERLQAKHVMSPGIRTVNDLERVGKLLDLLNTTTHHGFPVVATSQLERSVSPSADGATFPGGRPVFQRKPRVLGIILREQLVTILAKKKAHNWMPPASARAGSVDPAPLTSLTLTADDFLRPWFNEMVSHESIRMTPGAEGVGWGLGAFSAGRGGAG
jgi:chloride channel 7